MTAVSLRRARIGDAELVHAWRSEPSTAAYQPTLPLSLIDVRAMLTERASGPLTPTAAGKFQWLIEAAGEPVGWITLEIGEAARRHGNGVVGYTVGEAFRGRGFGRDGVAALLPIAFGRTSLNLERLEAVAAVENIASRRVLEANGFTQEGILRGLLIIRGVRVDHAIYGLLRSDWER
jgi:RimJ/RimL family protein N-acetyltransferase